MSEKKTNQPSEQKLEINTSRLFSSWLAEQKASILFTTYQAGKLFLIGTKPDKTLSLFERTFPRCMGIGGNSQTLYLSSLYQIWRLENSLIPGQQYQNYDRVYIPQVGYTTGDIDTHDITIDSEGKPIFVNTLFSCLATVSETHSFDPLWKPNFISRLAAEDRCHFNGLAMVDDQPTYVTMVSDTDVHEGWRDNKADSGLLMDIKSNEVLCRGLSMPHSPRFYRDKLWLLNSGRGEFGYWDKETGKFQSIAFCPGYPRGLSFVNQYAVIGLSLLRHSKIFSGLPIHEQLEKHKVKPRCGLMVVDLTTGDCVHSLSIEGIISELYDTLILPDVKCPMALGFQTDEIRTTLSMAPHQL